MFKFEDKVDKVAIDKDFDYVKFPDLPRHEQISCLPKIFVEEVEMNDKEEKFLSHEHKMKKHSPNHHVHWHCDKIKDASKCLSHGISQY